MTHLPDRVRSRTRRRGLTLLEVVISMAIFLFSITAIMQLTSMATDRAVLVQQQAMGTMLAQRKLAEVMVGATPLSSTGYTAFTDDGMEDWQWKLDATQNSINGVWNVQVSVKYEVPESGFQPVTVDLGQMVLDPTLRGSTLDSPPTQSLNNSNVPTGNGSSSSSGSSSGAAAGGSGGAAAPANNNSKGGAASKTGGGTPGGAGAGNNRPATNNNRPATNNNRPATNNNNTNRPATTTTNAPKG
jgi:type II secretion system protein I